MGCSAGYPPVICCPSGTLCAIKNYNEVYCGALPARQPLAAEPWDALWMWPWGMMSGSGWSLGVAIHNMRFYGMTLCRFVDAETPCDNGTPCDEGFDCTADLNTGDKYCCAQPAIFALDSCETAECFAQSSYVGCCKARGPSRLTRMAPSCS